VDLKEGKSVYDTNLTEDDFIDSTKNFELNLNGKNLIFSGWNHVDLKNIKFYNRIGKNSIIFENLLNRAFITIKNVNIAEN